MSYVLTNKIIKPIRVSVLTLLLFALLSVPSLISAVEVNKDGVEAVIIAPIDPSISSHHVAGHDLSDIESEGDQQVVQVYDPLETINRPIYEFNKGVDYVLLEPIATVYHEAMPKWGKDRVSSFLSNLYEPVNCINGALQGDAELVANSLGRFLTNTLLGVAGLFDVASTQPDMQPKNTDFGLTLKKHGADLGFYVVLPLLGPSSTRDATGKVFDLTFDPLNYKWLKTRYRNVKFAGSTITSRERLLDSIKTIRETSIDEYSAIRSIYWQKRK